jgi:18S rRNA (adenine1779-N6/adenine1780-N6)-dimethyltransferase
MLQITTRVSIALCRINLSRRFSTIPTKLKAARLVMRKRFGQHLLKNPDVVSTIVSLANIKPNETVFEIGPGTGNLTLHLLRQAQHVFACEIDSRLLEVLLKRLEEIDKSVAASAIKLESSSSSFETISVRKRFTVVHDDFLRVPLPRFDVLVANIPYQISSPVLRRLFTLSPAPRRAVIMFQLEFAQRMVAKPGTSEYCRLSVNCQMLADCEIVLKVGKEQFRPPPKIDSAVVRITPKISSNESTLRPMNLFIGSSFEDWDSFLRVLFASKNKTLRTVLTRSKPAVLRLTLLRRDVTKSTDKEMEKTKEDIESVLNDTETTSLRANAMTLSQFRTLYDALLLKGFRFSDKDKGTEERKEELNDESLKGGLVDGLGDGLDAIRNSSSIVSNLDDAVEPNEWANIVEKLANERNEKKKHSTNSQIAISPLDDNGNHNDDNDDIDLDLDRNIKPSRSLTVLKGRYASDVRRRERKRRAREGLMSFDNAIQMTG